MKKAEIVDRYTILCLKCEHGLDMTKELEAFEKEIEDVPKNLVEKLHEINALMWEVEDRAELGDGEMSELFVIQRNFNKTRVSIKNEIAKHFKEDKEQKLFL